MNGTASTRTHNWSATRHCRTRREVEDNVSDLSAGFSIQIRSMIATVEPDVRPDGAMAI